MKSPLNALVAVAFALMTPAAALAESLNVKTGAWEMTTTHVTTGMLIPADKLEQMPPAQRAALEKAMKARAGTPTTSVAKSCVTQADLDQDRMLESDGDGGCTQKVISKSSTKVVVDKTCPLPDASTSHMTIETETPEKIIATVDMAQGGGDGKVHVSISGRWLDASCAGINEGN